MTFGVVPPSAALTGRVTPTGRYRDPYRRTDPKMRVYLCTYFVTQYVTTSPDHLFVCFTDKPRRHTHSGRPVPKVRYPVTRSVYTFPRWTVSRRSLL